MREELGTQGWIQSQCVCINSLTKRSLANECRRYAATLHYLCNSKLTIKIGLLKFLRCNQQVIIIQKENQECTWHSYMVMEKLQTNVESMESGGH